MSRAADSFWDSLRREHFLVVGLGGITGTSAARLFRRMGVRFKASDAQPADTLRTLVAELGLRADDVFLGPPSTSQLDGITQILVSPGVPRSLPLLCAAKERKIPIWCDFDLLYPLYSDRRIVAITGTDGKTTTTSLVGHLLRTSSAVVVAGNIGTPICAVYDRLITSEVVVLELSSFMLESLVRFRADVSTVLNIAEDHVDRYATLLEYTEAKRNIVRHARPSDVFVKNLDDPSTSSLRLPSMATRTVSLAQKADVYLDGGLIHVGGVELPVARLQVRGNHLLSDVLVALAVATTLGLPADVACAGAATFVGVPHRFQSVGRVNDVDIIDDSKATSVNAVARALESLSDRKVVLLLGGRDKNLDPKPLSRFAAQLRAVVGYGEAGMRLLAPFDSHLVRYEHQFDVAVRAACRMAEPGDVLLLSPACTSFDQHRNYEERGDRFCQLARQHLTRQVGT